MATILLADEVFAIVGAAIEVHRELGSGFLEAVYQEALALELVQRQIQFTAQVPLAIRYKQQLLQKTYIADLICYNQIIVELKALNRLTTLEEAQLINYLKATQFRVGLLVNFGSLGKLEWKRLVR